MSKVVLNSTVLNKNWAVLSLSTYMYLIELYKRFSE